MPEGDTIHRSAARLRAALIGRPVLRIEVRPGAGSHRRRAATPPPIGTMIDEVSATGKHLLVRFADGSVLRSHLGMSGSWHLYHPGERWARPRHQLRALVAVDGWEAVCFSAPVVELTSSQRAGEAVDHLGPDLCRPDADLDEALRRFHALIDPQREIGDALLDQRVASGIGNVYKSEVLFACAVDPFTPVAAVDPVTRRRLLATASALLQANLASSGPRRTTSGGLSVYGRVGRPCRRCGTLVQVRRQGRHARNTFWCPTCQASRKPAGGARG